MDMNNYIYCTIQKLHMKNKVLLSIFLSAISFSSLLAQTIPNFSFETWVLDTNYLNLTVTSPSTLDTTVGQVPAGWTTSDEISNGRVFNHKTLVTQSNNAYTGSSAIQLRSDSLHAALVGLPSPFPNPYPINFVCPGFAICGSFPINLTAFVNIGASFNPALLPYAGIPISSRLDKIGGYMKYTPVGGDTAYVIAILRKGSTVVASATYTRATTDAAYSYFEAPFVYQNCLQPDTLVYTLSSGNPYSISGVAVGNPSGLHVGSTLLVDSIIYGGITSYGEAYPQNDSANTTQNTPVTIGVAHNDSSCSQPIFTLQLGTVAPKHGTVSIVGDSILYTPNHGYSGADTFSYTESVGTGPVSGPATVIVKINGYAAGISELAEGKTNIYPNPASNKLHITTSNASVNEFRILDMLGSIVKVENFSSNATVDLSGFNNGLYIIQFSSSEGKMISSTRFTVIK